jgi:putative nucleotidyltransferase with HDIG domain
MAAAYGDIEQILDEVVTLPSLPDTVVHLNQLLSDPNASMADVGKAISLDPSIALKTLRLVNSAYYGLGQEVKTVDHAVVMLGAKVIKNLVLTATVFDSFEGGVGRFLEHSIACGVAMKVLAAHGPLKRDLGSPDEAFVYGLLHDIGKVILNQYMPEACADVERHVVERRVSWREAELAVIGVEHASLGGRLAQKWKLSKQIAAAIAYHHDVNACPAEYQRLAGTLAVADHLVACAGYPSYTPVRLALPEEAWLASGLTIDAMPAVIGGFCAALNEITELMGLAAA